MEAEKNNPRDPKIHYYLGVCYHGKGLAKEAVVEFRKATSIKPDYSEAHNYLGLIYTEGGQLDEAISEYRAALANLLYETPSYAMSNLAWAYYKKGDYNAARAQYQEILNREPNSSILPIVERNMGIVLVAQENFAQALPHLQKSLEIAPLFAAEQTHYWMGKALAGQGKIKQAETEFQKSIEFAPNSKFAADSTAELEKFNKRAIPVVAKTDSTFKSEAAPQESSERHSKKETEPTVPAPDSKVTTPLKEESKIEPDTGPKTHVVKRGETLNSIARAYGLSLHSVCSANKLSTKYRVKVGERLVIPSAGGKKTAMIKPDSMQEQQEKIIKYYVRPGDSLTSVAKKFHTTMTDLKKLNNLKRDTLDKGQVIKIRTSQ
jgi:tetratricopeptide (TPR) repeat protein